MARLGPRLGMLVWDVGAGSGSVGVECAAHHAAVIAVERDPAACELIRRNAAARRSVRVVEASAPAAFDGLPDPDAVFVGGGGLDALGGVLARRPPTVVATYAAVDRVAPARRALARRRLRRRGRAARGLALRRPAGRLVPAEAQNPVFLLAGEAS